MKDVYIVQCLMETDLYKLLKTQVKKIHAFVYLLINMQIQPHKILAYGNVANLALMYYDVK